MANHGVECSWQAVRAAIWLFALLAIVPSSGVARSGGQADEASVRDLMDRDLSARDLRDLGPGQSVTRAITADGKHSYTVDLQAGDLVDLSLDRHGVALLVTAFDADGSRLENFGSSITQQGPLPVEFVAPATGTFRIEVRALGQPSPPGTYDLTVKELRPASSEDKSRQASESCREDRWRDDQGEFLVNAALDSIAECAAAVARKLEAEHPGAGAIADGLQGEVDFLNERWRWGEFVSEAYAASLGADFEALAMAATAPDAATALEILRQVSADVGIKADHCRNSSRGLGGDVTVEVTTQKEDRGDPGWQVFYKPRIFEFLEDYQAKRFPRPTDPSTTDDLPPGEYLIWAERPGQAGSSGTPDIVPVGEGKTRREWVLFVP